MAIIGGMPAIVDAAFAIWLPKRIIEHESHHHGALLRGMFWEY
jgi:hypothetical protein